MGSRGQAFAKVKKQCFTGEKLCGTNSSDTAQAQGVPTSRCCTLALFLHCAFLASVEIRYEPRQTFDQSQCSSFSIPAIAATAFYLCTLKMYYKALLNVGQKDGSE